MFDLDIPWLLRNIPYIWELTQNHLVLSFVPLGIGLLLALPIGILGAYWNPLKPLIQVLSSTFFAIPSLAFFIFLLPFTGLNPLTAILPLGIYAGSLLVRNVVEGIQGTSDAVRQAATAMGYRKFRRLLTIELPNALPIILGGLRVTSVSTISMASVASVLGISSLGDLFIDGAQRFFATPILVGIVLTLLLAAISDLLLVVLQRTLTPWAAGAKR
ncbi:ABC transporter permease [Micrococcoides hystricis]|uniref:ABC transporter permease n=1 Tax=Micrococcoides hystricis TaxID=1572761 RepID=A0ABV6PD98_9MICC